MPAAMASWQTAASFILLAPTSVISAPVRPVSRAAASISARIASKFSRIDIACASLSLSYLSRVRPLEAGAAVFIG